MILIIIVAAIIVAAVGLAIFLFTKSSQSSGNNNSQIKSRSTIIKNANKKLEKNPEDVSAILELANLYYSEDDYAKAIKYFRVLLSQGSKNQIISEFEVTKYAVCTLKMGNIDDAHKHFTYARSMNKNIFEVNYNLGVIEFDRKNYEKAFPFFQQAKRLMPDHYLTLQYMGKTLFQVNRFSDAIQSLKKSESSAPVDKENLFFLARSYKETGQIENSFRIFQRLRPDPIYGAQACLETGKMYLQKNSGEAAIADFELGLQHKNTKPELILELLYALAQTYVKTNMIQQALNIFEKILSINSKYKDVGILKTKYISLASNKNLNTYLLAPTADFVILCRKIVPLFFPNASIKITDIAATKDEYIDITSEIHQKQMEDTVLFRFIRTTAPVGDFLLRDIYFKSKDKKAGLSICVSAGLFTDGARQFAEGRTIDLIDEKKLSTYLKKI